MLTDADWDSLKLDEARLRSLSAKSPKGGVLVLNDTSFPKQGKASVGVARQYCGALGKRANCQVVVSAHYVADEPESFRPLHWPVSGRLYLPEGWANDLKRREISVPFEMVVADSGYGKYPSFLGGLEDREVAYVCGVESTFGVRLPEEVVAAKEAGTPPYKGRGSLPRSEGAPCSSLAGQGTDRLPARRGVANGELEGGDQGDFEQANGGTAGAPGDGKPYSQHRP